MDHVLGTILWTAVAVVAGMALQYSGFLPWLLSKLPWTKG